MSDAETAQLDAQIARMLELPQLASVKRLATALVDSIVADLPHPSAVESLVLLRKCAAIVVLAEQEGQRKIEPIADGRSRLIAALERRLVELECDTEELQMERSALRAIAVEQETLIAAQVQALALVSDERSLRELRLPH